LQNSSISCGALVWARSQAVKAASHTTWPITRRRGVTKQACTGAGLALLRSNVHRAPSLHRPSSPAAASAVRPHLGRHAAKGVGCAPRHQHALPCQHQARRLPPLLLQLPLALLLGLRGQRRRRVLGPSWAQRIALPVLPSAASPSLQPAGHGQPNPSRQVCKQVHAGAGAAPGLAPFPIPAG
jgi:hypothetical protein